MNFMLYFDLVYSKFLYFEYIRKYYTWISTATS